MNIPKKTSDDRASILIVAVGVLAVLSLMAVTFALVSRTELAGSRTLTDRQIAEFAAQQGLQTAVEILSKDDPRFDDFQEAWFTPPCPTDENGAPLTSATTNRSIAAGRPTPNPYHKLVYNDGGRRACYDLNWHINEDPYGDDNADGAPGIAGIDDDGDGKIDEDWLGRQPGDPGYDPAYAADDDEDQDQRYAMGLAPVYDEDNFVPDIDGRPGQPDIDDDHDGQVDEDNNGYADTDGDGLVYEDPGIPGGVISYYSAKDRPYKDTSYTRLTPNRYDNVVNDDLFTGDRRINENQGGKSFQPFYGFNGSSDTYSYPLPAGLWLRRSGWTYILDNYNYGGGGSDYNDGRVWEEGFGDIRNMGTGVAGIKHVDANCAGWTNIHGNATYTNPANLDCDAYGSTDGYYPLWTGNPKPQVSGDPEKNVPTINFVTYAGGRLGSNRQDDDEDSEGRIRTTVQAPSPSNIPDLETADGNDAEGMILDESGKINLNAHGSLWDPAFYSSATGALDGRMRLDSFTGVSLVRFFEAYGFTYDQARGFARAIILYRYGPDMLPGRARVDDDNNHDVPAGGMSRIQDIWSYRRLLVRDNGLDDNGNWIGANNQHDTGLNNLSYLLGNNFGNVNFNVGWQDGVPSYMKLTPRAIFTESNIDEANEGIDDDREFDPVYPRGDDRPYTSIEQMIDALVWGTTGGRSAPPYPMNDNWVASGVPRINQPLGVGYILRNGRPIHIQGLTDAYGNLVADNVGDIYAEASRIFNIVREDISVNVADLDVGKVNINIDLWHSDHLDNDNNGRIDIAREVSDATTPRRADQSNTPGGITVGTYPDGTLSVSRARYTWPIYPACAQSGEYDQPSPWELGVGSAEEDTRVKVGCEKVAALKRAFRRAFGARNAPYVDTIALLKGRYPFPYYIGIPTPTDSQGEGGVILGQEYGRMTSDDPPRPAWAFNLIGQAAWYAPNDPKMLGRLLRDQMWANIVDFQDPDTVIYGSYVTSGFSVPTMLVTNYPNLTPYTADEWTDYTARVSRGDVDIFGVEGLHINEVLLAPEIAGTAASANRTRPQASRALEVVNVGTDPPKFRYEDGSTFSNTDPDGKTLLDARWDPPGTNQGVFTLTVTLVNQANPNNPIKPVNVKVTGEWRIKGIPRGAYVAMAYGDSYCVPKPSSGTAEPDGLSHLSTSAPVGVLEVSFPPYDPTNTQLDGRNGVVLITPPNNTYDERSEGGIVTHSKDWKNPAFRRFHVPVKDSGTGSTFFVDECNEDYGFVTRPDIRDNPLIRSNPGYYMGGGANNRYRFMAIRVDADPEVGFLVRVRATSHWDPESVTDPTKNKFAHFNGLRLICPYIELVNISKQPIPLLVAPNGPPAYKLTCRANVPTTVDGTNYFFGDNRTTWPITRPSTGLQPGFYLGYDPRCVTGYRPQADHYPWWRNPRTNTREQTTFIPAAYADGMFPPNFGYYTLALSEAAYVGSFGNFVVPTANMTIENPTGSVERITNYFTKQKVYIIALSTTLGWGSDPEENYPVQFTEFPYYFNVTSYGAIPKQCDQILGFWNREQESDRPMLNCPLAIWGRDLLWGLPLHLSPANRIPWQILIAGGKIDRWAGNEYAAKGTQPVKTETVPLDYFAVEKTSPVYPNLAQATRTHDANRAIARFAPVNANDDQFYAGMNAAWLQIPPASSATKPPASVPGDTTNTTLNFQRWADIAGQNSNPAPNSRVWHCMSLWWRCSQRNLWRPNPTDMSYLTTTVPGEPTDVVLLRRRYANWNKNYMYLFHAGTREVSSPLFTGWASYPLSKQPVGRKYLYPGHSDDVFYYTLVSSYYYSDVWGCEPSTWRVYNGATITTCNHENVPRQTSIPPIYLSNTSPGSWYAFDWMDLVERRMAMDNRTVPVVLDNAFPTVGWLAFVHSALGPWKNLAPLLPEERIGENDVGQLFIESNIEYFDDNILTRLIGLSGGFSLSYASGELDTKYSYRPTPFTVAVSTDQTMNNLRPVKLSDIDITQVNEQPSSILFNYRSTVYPRANMPFPYNYEQTPDWREIATVWPHGRARARININTASMPVLASVFSTAMAADIIRYRPYRDILDVMGFSGFMGSPAYEPTGTVETSEIRRRIVPTKNRGGTNAWETYGIKDLRNQRGPIVLLPTDSRLQTNLLAEVLRGDPFFTKNAYYTLLKTRPIWDGPNTMGAGIISTRELYGSTGARPTGGAPISGVTIAPQRMLDYDDTGAGRLNDDLADDIAERMEWFNRYWNVIDIKSRFFTVIARGRVFSGTGLLAEARLRAIVERQDVVNNLNTPPWATAAGAGGLQPSPTPGADGITDSVRVLSSRFITEY